MFFDNVLLDLPLDIVPDTPVLLAANNDAPVSKLGAPTAGADGVLGAFTRIEADAGYRTGLGGIHPGDALTLSIWIRVQQIGGDALVVSLSDEAGGILAIKVDRDKGGAALSVQTQTGKGNIRLPVPTGVWRQITLVQAAKDKTATVGHEVFIDGVSVHSWSDVPTITGPAQLTLGANDAGSDLALDLAHARVFNAAMTAPEIQQLKAADRSPLALLNEAEPLNVRLLDDSGAPRIYIEDHAGGLSLTLEVQNVSSYGVQIDASRKSVPLSLTFPPGALEVSRRASRWVVPLLEGTPWLCEAQVDRADGSVRLEFQPKGKGVRLEPLAVETITIKSLRAQPGDGTRPARVLFGFTDIEQDQPTGPQKVSGSREKMVQIVNHTGSRFVPLDAKIIGPDRVLTGDKDAGLTLRVVNTSTGRPIEFLAPHDDGTGAMVPRSALVVQLTGVDATKTAVIADQMRDEQELLAAGGRDKMRLDAPTGWTARLEAADGPHPTWVVTPDQDLVLGPGEHLELALSLLSISGTPGRAPLTVIHRGLPGFWYGSQVIEIEKSQLYFSSGDRVGINVSDPSGILHVHSRGDQPGAVVASSPEGSYTAYYLRPGGYKQSSITATLNSMMVTTEEETLWLGGAKRGRLFQNDGQSSSATVSLEWTDAGLHAFRPLTVEGVGDGARITQKAAAGHNAWLELTHGDGATTTLQHTEKSGALFTDRDTLYVGARKNGTLYVRTDDDTIWHTSCLWWDENHVLIRKKLDVEKDATIDGDLEVKGAITAATKHFRIPNPLEPDRTLTYGSLEGPELGIYLRGGGVLQDGQARIELPPYFAVLARPEGRTVQLTARGRVPFVLSYDDMDTNGFTVFGASTDGRFDWELRAARADQPPLDVDGKGL